jgi:hypothetical protein
VLDVSEPTYLKKMRLLDRQIATRNKRAKVYSTKSTEKECANPNDDVSIQRTIRSMFMRYKYVQIRADDRLLEAHKCKLQTPHATYLIVYISIRNTYKYVFFSGGPWCMREVLCFVCTCFYWRHFAKKRNLNEKTK